MAIIRGRVWKFGDNINTDLMLPNIALSKPDEEQTKYCFWANRPGWAEQVTRGDIIIGGVNFGMGSGRQGSRILKQLGIAAAIADSVASMFMRNSVNLGFRTFACPGVSKAFEEGDLAEIDTDKTTVKNLRTGEVLQGEAIPKELNAIFEAGGILPLLKKEGYLK